MKYFDWNLAATLINSAVRGSQEVDAGIDEDWSMTAGTIFKDGKPVLDGGAFLHSFWGTPALQIGDKRIICATYKKQPDNWPASALKKLGIDKSKS